MIGFKMPFHLKQTYVYLTVVDAEDKLFCFMAIDQLDHKNGRRFIDMLNKASKQNEIHKSKDKPATARQG